MLIGIWNYHEILHTNNFLLSKENINCLGEDVLQSFYEFYLELKSLNHEVVILNEDTSYKKYDLFIFFNYPNSKKKYVLEALESSKKKYLFNLECPTIYPETWNNNNYKKFDKVFTWDDTLIDNIKFIKINAPSYSKKRIEDLQSNIKNKFSIIVGSNKTNDHINDLYYKRIEIIQWYEENNVGDLDFYGHGWSNYIFRGPLIIRALNRIPFLTSILAPKYKNYKGAFNGRKVDLLKDYKFSFCIENAKGYPGYITEKIFHCFFSLTVPIYLGCPNILDYIPSDCFIDMRKFKTIKEVNFFLKNLKEEEYQNYQISILKFLKSSKFIPFSNEYYIKTLRQHMLI